MPGFPQQLDPTFATWLAYVPPARRRAEFKPRAVLAPVPSQAQLYPTILELLGGEARPASFAFALRGEKVPGRYQDCHALGQPAGRRLIIYRNGERAEFDLASGDVRAGGGGARLTADLRTFQERFGCKTD